MRQSKTELLVCATCRAGQDIPEDGERPGARLLAALKEKSWPEGIEVVETACLSNCSSGCTIALRGAGRWTFVYGNLNAQDHAEIIHDGACKYRNAADGLVPWRERPEYFRKNCIARVPPLLLEE